jgi:hypothetical protein
LTAEGDRFSVAYPTGISAGTGNDGDAASDVDA